jgi:hypothetical protein
MSEERRSFGWGRASAVVAALLVAGMVATGGMRVGAQTAATPVAGTELSRPAHIHSGDCVNLGEVVWPLTNLTEPTGNSVGQANKAISAESSLTVVPVPLDQILASDHAINVHLSADQIGTYIACGEVGGVVDANGALTIGLRELNNSGYTGIAYLAPSPDGAGTTVSVFIAKTHGGAVGGPTASPMAAATPMA